MDFTAKENIPGLLLFIDFQKAFDSVEWEFLIESLKKFNFGRDFLQWVKTFYNNIQSCVINNGVSSNFFTLERGVRQGDPLSPYLFIIAVETLAIAIRQKESIKGITIGTEETKLLQFADDTTAVLADSSSVERLFELLNTFEILSGLKINCSKTEGMWIGSKRHYQEKPFGVKWPDEPIKVLGVCFTYDQKLIKEKNSIERSGSIKNLLICGPLEAFCRYGKVTIIKSFLSLRTFTFVRSFQLTINC